MAIAARLGDAAMEMNHRRDATISGGYGGRNCGIPWKNMPVREVIFPRHIR